MHGIGQVSLFVILFSLAFTMQSCKEEDKDVTKETIAEIEKP